jgi:iron complex transport system ATP-binding protein
MVASSQKKNIVLISLNFKMTIRLEAKSLTIGYTEKSGEKVIASNIHLTLKSSTLVGLVGGNGVGKSTLIRTLTGIQKKLSGDLLLQGIDIVQFDSLSLAKEISVVLTEKLPPSNLTVYELIALGRQPYTNWLGKLSENDKEKINEAIELTGVGPLVEKKHYEISDGQLQKVLIARAIAQDTPLIILDEPTTHLDLFHKVSLFKLLKQLTIQTGKCVFFSTHDIDMAIQLADEMVVMTSDSVIQDQPCNLISKGVFENLFKEESIQFDASKGKFIIS